MAKDYRDIAQALATIPPAQKIKVLQCQDGPGRPALIPGPSGDAWTRDELLRAPPPQGARYSLRPLTDTGRLSGRTLSLNLQMEESSVSVGTPQSEQESVVTVGASEALLDTFIRSSDMQGKRISELEARVDMLIEEKQELADELHAIKLAAAVDSTSYALRNRDNSVGGIIERAVENFLTGPGGRIVGERALEIMAGGAKSLPGV